MVFERDYDPSLPELHGDKDRLHRVFLNLIINAVEASQPGDKITIRTGMRGPWQELEPLPDPAKTYFQIEIEDEGVGLDESGTTSLFTPFRTTKKRGHGLGLSVSYQIIRAHEGNLNYRPGSKKGTIFTITLPMDPGS